MAADVCEAIRFHLPSIPACCGSPCGGGVGLGVRFLPNCMWWRESLHLGWHFCCGVSAFDSAGISYHNTKQQSLPFTCLSFVCFCFLIVISIVEL